MGHLKPISGERTIKILCKEFGFEVSGQRGSHVRLRKNTPEGKVGTVVPFHRELKVGTLRGILKLGKITIDKFITFV